MKRTQRQSPSRLHLRAGAWLCMCLILAMLPLRGDPQISPPPPEGTLRLAIGDVYEGQWLPSEGELIRWRSPWFAEPLLLECRYLEELALKPIPHEYGDEPLRVQVGNGDVLHGDLVALDDRTLTLRCQRHGPVRLNRSGLLKLTRLNNPSLVFAGPSSLDGWTMPETESRRRRETAREPVQFWDPVPGGGLRTERWRAELYRPLSFPEKLEVDLQISCSSRPEFSLALDQDVENSVRLETWDSALVLTKGPRFQLVRMLDEKERRLRMRLFWDQKEGSLSLYDSDHDLLVTAPFQEKGKSAGQKPGFYIRNKSIDMTLEQLRIAKWNGLPPKKMQDRGIRIRRSDGVVLRDGILSLEPATHSLVLQAGDRLPVAEIDTIFFREDGDPEERPGGVEFSYPDGTRISGTLLGVRAGSALVRTSYAAEPVTVNLAGLDQIRFPGAEDPLPVEAGDELYIEGDVFRGMVSGGGEQRDGEPIRWQPLGATNAVSIVPGRSAQILRRRSQAVSNLDGDRLFLKTGEILSCRVLDADAKAVRLRTGLSPMREVPLEMVKAVEFREGRLQMVGFGDREWQEKRTSADSLIREPGRLTLNGGSLYHPGLLRGDEVYFGLNWKEKGQSALTLGLFGSQLPAGQLPLEISFTCWGNRLWVSATEPATGQRMDDNDVVIEGGASMVAVRTTGERVTVHLNGVELMQIDFPASKRSGNGLLLATGSNWPNGDAKLNPLAIDRFEVCSSTGLLNPLRVDPSLKERALLVPRFRRDNPDTHVLIGSNGDLIRGRLDSITEERVSFVTRLRDIALPRDRLAGLVRLEDQPFEPPRGAPTDAGVFLTDGSVIRIQPVRMTPSILEGISPALGTCQLPVAHIRQIRLGGFDPIPGAQLYADWVRTPAPEPVFPESSAAGGGGSGLVNRQAPDFSLRMVDGESFRLSAELGRVVVLTFWASWSGQSRQGIEDLLKSVTSAGPRLRFVTVNQAETGPVIQSYLDKNKWSFPVAIDPSEKVGQSFGLESLPHTVVIDATGKIRWAESGFRLGAGAEISELLRQLVDEAKDLPLSPPAEPGKGQTPQES